MELCLILKIRIYWQNWIVLCNNLSKTLSKLCQTCEKKTDSFIVGSNNGSLSFIICIIDHIEVYTVNNAQFLACISHRKTLLTISVPCSISGGAQQMSGTHCKPHVCHQQSAHTSVCHCHRRKKKMTFSSCLQKFVCLPMTAS
jgi:hypothetical protein